MFSSSYADKYAWFTVDLHDEFAVTDLQVWLASGLSAPPFTTLAVYISNTPLRTNSTTARRPFASQPCFNSSVDSVTTTMSGYLAGSCTGVGRFVTVQFTPVGGSVAVLRFCALQVFGELLAADSTAAGLAPQAPNVAIIAAPVVLGSAAIGTVVWTLGRRRQRRLAQQPALFSPEAPQTQTRASLLLQQEAAAAAVV